MSPDCPAELRWQETKKGLQALAGDCPEKPPQVLARCAQHRMQPVTNLALQVTAIHSVIGFQVTDHWLVRRHFAV